MHRKYNPLFLTSILLVLFLFSYRFSLLQQTTLLPYLAKPELASPFERLMTYTFMIIGLPPTMLLILYTSIFCTTTYPHDVVTYMCFGKPFLLESSSGFMAYLVASLLAAGCIYYLFLRKQK